MCSNLRYIVSLLRRGKLFMDIMRWKRIEKQNGKELLMSTLTHIRQGVDDSIHRQHRVSYYRPLAIPWNGYRSTAKSVPFMLDIVTVVS